MKKMIKRKTVILCMLLLGISVSGCGKTREVDEASSKVIQISVAPEETSPTPAPDQVASAAVTTNGNLTMVNTYLAEQDAAGISSAEVQTAKVMPTVQITVSTQQITMSKTAVHQILRNRKQVITGADYNGEKEYHRFSHGNLCPHSILHKKM